MIIGNSMIMISLLSIMLLMSKLVAGFAIGRSSAMILSLQTTPCEGSASICCCWWSKLSHNLLQLVYSR